MKHSSDGITWTDIQEALDEVYLEERLIKQYVKDNIEGEYANYYHSGRISLPYDPKKDKK